MTPFVSDPVIVLGMHRSGTSLLAGLLQENGLELGDINSSAPNNRRGNREYEALRDMHEKIFAAREASWKLPPSPPVDLTANELSAIMELLSAFRDSDFWGFKDPRAVWLVEAYLKLFPGASFIGIFRNPEAVARSLAARPGALRISYEQGLALWLRTNRRLVELYEKFSFPILYFGPDLDRSSMFDEPLQQFLQRHGRRNASFDFYDDSLVNQRYHPSKQESSITHLFNQLQNIASTH